MVTPLATALSNTPENIVGYVIDSGTDLVLRELRRMNLLLAMAFGVDIPVDADLEEGYAA